MMGSTFGAWSLLFAIACVVLPSSICAHAQVSPILAQTQDGGVGNSLGYSFAILDYNRDGAPDVIVCGCPFDDGANNDLCNSGCVTVFNFNDGSKRMDIFPPTVEEGDLFGAALSAGGDIGGDINGDTFNDLVIGAPLANVSGLNDAGRIFIVSGAWIADPTNPNIAPFIATIEPPMADVQATAQFGAAVAVIGDSDGRGFADFAVGAPRYSPTGLTNAGRVYVYSGGATPQAIQIIGQRNGDAANDNFGAALAGTGNLGNIGSGGAPGNQFPDPTPTNPDFLAGAPGKSSNAGDVYAFGVIANDPTPLRLIYRTSQTPSPPPALALWRFGSSIAAGGRYLSDGGGSVVDNPDAVIGAPGANGTAGAVVLVSHTNLGISYNVIPAPTGTSSTTRDFGRSVAFLDRECVNGKPFADLLVGAPISFSPSASGVGSAFFFYKPTSISTGQVVSIANPAAAAYDLFGAVVATSGGPFPCGGPLMTRRLHIAAPFDNFADLNSSDNANTTSVDVGTVRTYVVSVDPGTDVASVALDPLIPRLNGTLSGTQFGYAVAGGVDIDVDGTDDVLIGAPRTDSPTQAAQFPQYSSNGCDTGAVFIYGGMTNAPFIASVRQFANLGEAGSDAGNSQDTHAQFGSALEGLPALSAPNRDQFIATAPFYDQLPGPVVDFGFAGVYAYNPALGAVVIEDEPRPDDVGVAGDLFGFAVAEIGDVVIRQGETMAENDFAISAPLKEVLLLNGTPLVDAGRVFVYAGRVADGVSDFPTMPNYSIDATDVVPATDVMPGAQFGFSLDSASVHLSVGAPPVQRWLLVGAPFNDKSPVQPDTGSVFIFRLTATGPTYLGRLDGGAAADHFGWSVAFTFDTDSDGTDDFLVGAPGYDMPPDPNHPSLSNSGRVYVYSGVDFHQLGFIENGAAGYAPTAQDLFGYSMTGRVNPPNTVPPGQQRPQIVIGAPGADVDGQANRGVAVTYSALTLAGTAGPEFRSLLVNSADLEHLPGDRLGVSVAGVGVIPFGGMIQDTVLVGAPWVDAIDPDGRLIRNKGKSYAFGHIDLAMP